MPASLDRRQRQRARSVRRLVELGEPRPGSIGRPAKRRGKASRHCSRDGDPGHLGRAQLTSKAAGKTVTESLSSPAARRKAEREISEYRGLQQWTRSFVEVNITIRRLRPVEEDDEATPREK